MNRLLVSFLFIPLLMIACSSTAVSPATAVPSEEVETSDALASTIAPTHAAEPPTATVTMEPRPIATNTSKPTHTPRPTNTPEPTPVMLTQPELEAIFAAAAPRSVLGTYPSPDGRLQAESVRYDCTMMPPAQGEGEPYEQAYEVFRLVDETGKGRVFADQSQACGGLGAAGLQGYFWSDDGRYFYFGPAREGVPDGCGYFTTPYYRLDTSDLSTTYLGFGPLSPDKTTLALWTEGSALAIYTVNGERLARIEPIGSNTISNTIAWSPDSRSLVYVLTADYCPEGASTLIRIDLADLDPVVLREDDPGYAYAEWLSADSLRLTNIAGDMTLAVSAVDGESVP